MRKKSQLLLKNQTSERIVFVSCFFPESNPVRSALGIGIYGFIDSLNYHGLSLSAVDRENYWGSRLCMPLSLSLHLAWTSVRAREHMEEVGIGNDVTL